MFLRAFRCAWKQGENVDYEIFLLGGFSAKNAMILRFDR